MQKRNDFLDLQKQKAMEITDYTQCQAVMYEITETTSFNTLSEKFTDLGHGNFNQATEIDRDSKILDIQIHGWVDKDGNDVVYTPEMKREFIEFLNEQE